LSGVSAHSSMSCTSRRRPCSPALQVQVKPPGVVGARGVRAGNCRCHGALVAVGARHAVARIARVARAGEAPRRVGATWVRLLRLSVFMAHSSTSRHAVPLLAYPASASDPHEVPLHVAVPFAGTGQGAQDCPHVCGDLSSAHHRAARVGARVAVNPHRPPARRLAHGGRRHATSQAPQWPDPYRCSRTSSRRAWASPRAQLSTAVFWPVPGFLAQTGLGGVSPHAAGAAVLGRRRVRLRSRPTVVVAVRLAVRAKPPRTHTRPCSGRRGRLQERRASWSSSRSASGPSLCPRTKPRIYSARHLCSRPRRLRPRSLRANAAARGRRGGREQRRRTTLTSLIQKLH